MFQSYNHGLHCLTVGHKAPLFNAAWLAWLTNQALGVWRLDNPIYQIKPYPVKSAIPFAHTCQLESNLSIFCIIHLLSNWTQIEIPQFDLIIIAFGSSWLWIHWVGNLRWKCQVSPVEYKCYIFNYEGAWGKSFSLVSECLSGRGLQGQTFKAWSMCRESLLLILPFTKKKWVKHLTMNYAPWAPIYKSSNACGVAQGGCWNFELINT